MMEAEPTESPIPGNQPSGTFRLLITLMIRIPGVALWFIGVATTAVAGATITDAFISDGPIHEWHFVIQFILGSLIYGGMVVIGQAMRVTADILCRDVLVVFDTPKLCIVTVLDALRTLFYSLGAGLAGGCLLIQETTPRALWLLPITGISFFIAHSLNTRSKRLREKWQKEAQEARPLPPVSTPPH